MIIFPQLFGSVRRIYKRKIRKFSLSKRQLFVIITGLLTGMLLLTQLMPPELRYPMVVFISAVTYLCSAFALREDLSGIEWLTLLILPTLFTAGVSVYYFLLPVRWLTRIPVVLLYGLGIYALMLTENIYNVAANRTIALLRAAHTIGFLITLVTFFLLVQTVYATRLMPFLNPVLVFGISILLYIQTLWSVRLTKEYEKQLVVISFTLSVAISEIAFAISFMPVTGTMATLLLTAWFYITAGLAQQYLMERMYKKTIIEFAVVLFFVFVLFLFSARWQGN